jgi:hypothetical protein
MIIIEKPLSFRGQILLKPEQSLDYFGDQLTNLVVDQDFLIERIFLAPPASARKPLRQNYL